MNFNRGKRNPRIKYTSNSEGRKQQSDHAQRGIQYRPIRDLD